LPYSYEHGKYIPSIILKYTFETSTATESNITQVKYLLYSALHPTDSLLHYAVFDDPEKLLSELPRPKNVVHEF
jgi:hypothetical protein